MIYLMIETVQKPNFLFISKFSVESAFFCNSLLMIYVFHTVLFYNTILRTLPNNGKPLYGLYFIV